MKKSMLKACSLNIIRSMLHSRSKDYRLTALHQPASVLSSQPLQYLSKKQNTFLTTPKPKNANEAQTHCCLPKAKKMDTKPNPINSGHSVCLVAYPRLFDPLLTIHPQHKFSTLLLSIVVGFSLMPSLINRSVFVVLE
jgi:hypothetical protein